VRINFQSETVRVLAAVLSLVRKGLLYYRACFILCDDSNKRKHLTEYKLGLWEHRSDGTRMARINRRLYVLYGNENRNNKLQIVSFVLRGFISTVKTTEFTTVRMSHMGPNTKRLRV
jgi:hypothetical protein